MTAPAQDMSSWQFAFQERAAPLTRRWRRHRLGARLLSTLWLPMAVSLGLVGLQRWSLVELPQPDLLMLLPVPLWLVLMTLWWLLDRPKSRALARAADRVLGLDERLTTALELGTQPIPQDRLAAELVRRQREDALTTLAYANARMGHTFPFYPGKYLKPLGLAAAISLLLVPTLFVPSFVEPLRLEQAALRTTALQQADLLERRRRESVARPQLPPALSALLDQELGGAAGQLRNAPTDRAAAVAALTGAEDRLRKELPDDFKARLSARSSAARDIQAAVPADVRSNDPPPEGTSELGKAALAAEQLADVSSELLGNPDLVNSVLGAAGSLERAANNVVGTDRELATQLRAAASALRTRNAAVAQTALQNAAAALRAADADQTTLATLSNAVDQLAQGRNAVAGAGRPAASPGAPGSGRPAFGRPAVASAPAGGAAGAGGAGSGPTTPGTGTDAPPANGSDVPSTGSTAPGSAGTNPSSGPQTDPGSSPSTTGGGTGSRDPGGNRSGTGVGLAPTPGPGGDPNAPPPEQV